MNCTIKISSYLLSIGFISLLALSSYYTICNSSESIDLEKKIIERSTITAFVQLSFLTFSLVHYCFIWKSPTTAVETTLFYNHNGKYLHLQGTPKFYILQIFLQCFLHSTNWFWPKSTSTISPKFYISTRFFSTFSTFYKSILGQFYILHITAPPSWEG